MLFDKRIPPDADARDLFILKNDHLGDLLISLPVIYALSQWVHKAGGRLALIVNPCFCSFVEQMDYVDKVIPIEQKRGRSLRFRAHTQAFLRSELADYRFEYAINLLGINRLLGDDIFMTSIAAKHYACMTSHFSPCKHDGGNRLYDMNYLYNDAICLQQNEFEFYKFLTDGQSIVLRAFPEYFSSIPPSKNAPLSAIPDDTIAFIPGAADSRRQWPAEKFAALCEELLLSKRCSRIAVLGNAEEKKLAETIIGIRGSAQNVIDLTGQTSLGQLIALLPKFKAVISNDTGTMHLASLLDCPVVCILGGGHYGVFMPNPLYRRCVCVTTDTHSCFGCSWLCPKEKEHCAAFSCIETIDVSQVIKSLDSILNQLC